MLTAFEVAVQLELKKLLGHFPVAIAARVIGPPPPPLEVKFAATDFGAFMVRFWGVVVPVRSPLKPENVNPLFAAALTGDMTVDDALSRAQDVTTREMTKAGYIK